MLNTDAFNPQVKNRMSKLEFIKNNRGINDGQDLPEEFLSDIYDNIYSNEIRMKDEIETHVMTPAPGLVTVFGRDMQKEAYLLQSVGMANKTEVKSSFSLHLWEERAQAIDLLGTFQDDDARAAQGSFQVE